MPTIVIKPISITISVIGIHFITPRSGQMITNCPRVSIPWRAYEGSKRLTHYAGSPGLHRPVKEDAMGA